MRQLTINGRTFKTGDIVRHFKRETLQDPGTKYMYAILGFAKHTETGEMLVLYQALYEDTEMHINYDVLHVQLRCFSLGSIETNIRILGRSIVSRNGIWIHHHYWCSGVLSRQRSIYRKINLR